MDQEVRNKLRNVVTQCRKLLEDSISQELEGKYGIFAKKDHLIADPHAKMSHLSEEEQAARKDILDHFTHIKARGFKSKDALDQLVREIAFTHLNRLCAYKMMEVREVYAGGQKFREAVSRSVNSNGVKFYLAEHEDDERLFNTGHQDVAYRHFLDWLGGTLSDEIGVLFNPNDPANRLYPRQKTLDEVLELLNEGGIKAEESELRSVWPQIWSQDETIGWVYQYFTPKELRDQARKESSAPRNSYELAFRNQFFTPRYVVEFLTDNTLGRIWYEMQKGDTKLKDQCRYMVRRPTEIFLKDGEQPPKDASEERDDLSQEELLKLPVYIPHRPKKDPRDLKILDPACGSGHFLMYCFDLLLTIYEEAYADPDLGPVLQMDYPKLEDLRRDVPGLILAHNLHGIDIDLRASQIAALALWLRCQRAYQEMGLKKDRPKITRSNFVCAEPMPGESEMLKEFVADLQPKVLGHLVEIVFDKMKLAGEAGSLLKIEEELRDAIADAKKKWVAETEQATDRKGQPLLFTVAEMDRLSKKTREPQLFDFSEITDEQFWNEAEGQVLSALRKYAAHATNGRNLEKQLFAEDAERGFAFIDLCQKRFVVVLMNPPFGEAIPLTRAFVTKSYSSSSADLGAAFIARGLSLLAPTGEIGAIASRTYLTNDGLDRWRQDFLLGKESFFHAFADLGFGVLDDAKVEAACYVCGRNRAGIVPFYNVLDTSNKDSDLLRAIRLVSLVSGRRRTLQNIALFLNVPDFVLCYWLPPKFLKACLALPNLKAQGSEARVGLQTGDNHRFVRAVWEVDPARIGKSGTWVFFAKGGEYEPFYDDIHLVVKWEDDGKEIKGFTDIHGDLLSRPQNLRFYMTEGITYPDRTTSDFSPRIMPTGIIFSSTGFALFPPNRADLLGYLGAAYSRPFKILLEPFVGSGDFSASGSMARHYRPGILNNLPNFLSDASPAVCEAIAKSISTRIRAFSDDETTRYFVAPRYSSALSIRDVAARAYAARIDDACDLIEINCKIEGEIAERMQDRSVLAECDYYYATHPASYPRSEESGAIAELLALSEREVIERSSDVLGASRHVFMKSYFGDRKTELICHILKTHPRNVAQAITAIAHCPVDELRKTAADTVSYATGCIYGRWDCRFATGQLNYPQDADPFAQLPVSAPGMLQGSNGLPLNAVPPGYPAEISRDGIIPDDPDHADDMVRGVRIVLEAIWKNRTEAIEREACEILGVKELRDYFRKPGKGGFWEDHISRYSKSRRKAPIYWLLQSSKKNYAIWLYYHRLDKDLLFKALVNYVEPKIRLEGSRLETLRAHMTAAGETGKEAKRLAKDLERQEEFLSELRDFEDKLRRAANLHLEPDLNDGVVLNIAPLHELVPWKEAKNYWQELIAGKYEWSSIGKQLRQKGLVK